MPSSENPLVFFDIMIGGTEAGRITMQARADSSETSALRSRTQLRCPRAAVARRCGPEDSRELSVRVLRDSSVILIG